MIAAEAYFASPAVVTDLPFGRGDDVALMINGLAAPAEIAIRTF
jgi:hypothetical protein